MTQDDLKVLLEDVFNQHATFSVHAEHHAWIQARIETEKAKRELYRSLLRVVLQWSIPSLLAALGYFFQNGRWPGG